MYLMYLDFINSLILLNITLIIKIVNLPLVLASGLRFAYILMCSKFGCS